MSMSIDNLIPETRKRMEDALAAMQHSFRAIRTGKASPSLVEGLTVDYYGTPTKLRDIASITAPEPRLVVIQPWDQSAVKGIEKAIQTSDLGISPVSDGRVIRLPVPELSEERRNEYARMVKKHAEDTRVEIRNIRRDANEVAKNAEKASDITEDDLEDLLEETQKLTDASIEKVNELVAQKQEELLQV